MAGSGMPAVRCTTPELTHRGTLPPFADAAIAHAAFPRTCGSIFSVVQRISPERPFEEVKSGNRKLPFRHTTAQQSGRGQSRIMHMQRKRPVSPL
jgi:hypothetical protein